MTISQTQIRLMTAAAVGASLTLIALIPANAAIIMADSEFGMDSVVRDTDTSLDWLTFRFAGTNDVDQLLLDLAPGGTLDGWRLATADDVTGFWANAGIARTSSTGDRTYVTDQVIAQAAEELALMIGLSTDGGGSFDFVSGYIADPGNAGGEWAAAVLSAVYNGQIDVFDRYYAITGLTLSRTQGVGDAYHSWLIRDVARDVPAPGALGLLGLGILSLAARRRGRR
ncbi:PEP-CTERM sorting domain-containing protein [Pacificimonas sp. WHA3]|uniref:PEP-CTERM sorting domain-containing protein n=1 Tax=Pacificimonas pallii TaxID=2827236 RepID=A0ABS6SB50_9SPHN|nr:PEP-CTERM sorting domain-containing protein [Pacificimonas pallii]MBV7255546.1 PEP-CTERM sorting domain-containing protein [Pacificimonas pallii]